MAGPGPPGPERVPLAEALLALPGPERVPLAAALLALPGPGRAPLAEALLALPGPRVVAGQVPGPLKRHHTLHRILLPRDFLHHTKNRKALLSPCPFPSSIISDWPDITTQSSSRQV